jgi:hypothetical protein
MSDDPGPYLHFPNRVWGGLTLGLCAQIAFAALCLLENVSSFAGGLGDNALYLIGGSQALWVLPLLIHLYRTSRRPMAQGVWIVAGLTALLNATLMALVLAAL